ncbi:SufE family protein [bacterium]|nr:SufE family protein [bacterium]
MTVDDLINNFNMMEEWEDKYSYLIELGRELSPFEAKNKTDECRIYGCSSSVWWNYKVDENGKYRFAFDSDALIVKGLLYILTVIFNEKTVSEIKAINAMEIFDKMGLSRHLSAQRQVGITSVISKIQSI